LTAEQNFLGGGYLETPQTSWPLGEPTSFALPPSPQQHITEALDLGWMLCSFSSYTNNTYSRKEVVKTQKRIKEIERDRDRR
jgi:hypothetical protein